MSDQDSHQQFGEADLKVVLVNGDVVEVTFHRHAVHTAQYWEETLAGTQPEFEIEVKSLEWAREHQPTVDFESVSTWDRL